jgi:hypothetical protein
MKVSDKNIFFKIINKKYYLTKVSSHIGVNYFSRLIYGGYTYNI